MNLLDTWPGILKRDLQGVNPRNSKLSLNKYIDTKWDDLQYEIRSIENYLQDIDRSGTPQIQSVVVRDGQRTNNYVDTNLTTNPQIRELRQEQRNLRQLQRLINAKSVNGWKEQVVNHRPISGNRRTGPLYNTWQTMIRDLRNPDRDWNKTLQQLDQKKRPQEQGNNLSIRQNPRESNLLFREQNG